MSNPFEDQKLEASTPENPFSPPGVSSVPGTGEFMRPHRGEVILGLGITSLVTIFCGWIVGCCCSIFGAPFLIVAIVLGIIAGVMGNADLRAIEQGKMNPAGRSNTQIGMYLGIIGCVLSFLSILAVIGLFIVAMLSNNGGAEGFDFGFGQQ